MTRTRQALLSFLLILGAAGAGAQQICSGCEWTERGDRSEGVKTKSLMISGGSFELTSVAYLGGRGAASADASLRLSFWMPEAGALEELKVWAPMPSESDREKVSYVMEPSRKEYAAGRVDFDWPQGDVVAPLGMPLESLNVLIRDGHAYLPGLLTSRAGTAPAGVAFVFESSAGIDADCEIVRAGDGAVVRWMECYEDMGGTIAVSWDGRDDDGNAAADGEYVLRIDGDMLAEVIRPLETSVPFRHRGSLE